MPVGRCSRLVEATPTSRDALCTVCCVIVVVFHCDIVMSITGHNFISLCTATCALEEWGYCGLVPIPLWSGGEAKGVVSRVVFVGVACRF